jgi:hypothetical protein
MENNNFQKCFWQDLLLFPDVLKFKVHTKNYLPFYYELFSHNSYLLQSDKFEDFGYLLNPLIYYASRILHIILKINHIPCVVLNIHLSASKVIYLL